MEKIKISKGFTTPLAGMPDIGIVELSHPETLGLSARGIPHIRPKLLVREKDRVKTGTPLFCDKRDKSIQYVSPGTGVVKKIVFGERRRLQEIVIAIEKEDDFIQFDPLPLPDIATVSKQDLVMHLKQGGVWQNLRQFPAKDTADSDHTPAMIIVSLNGNDIFSPDPGVLLEQESTAFYFGLEVLKKFSDRIIVTAKESSLDRLGKIKSQVTHTVPDIYPAWDPAVILYHLKKNQTENTSWCIGVDHLIMMAKFLMTGQYPTKKIVTITRENSNHPHVLTRQGVPIIDLVGSFNKKSLVTTGKFNGSIAEPDSHLGFFENTLNIINPPGEDELFGFIRPGASKATVSKTFLSCLFSAPKEVDCALHGELRACINCSYCENICPNDLMPNFIIKALLSDEIEDALAHGLLDCCQCGLCSYACPSKIELAQILSDGINAHYKDKA